MKRLTLVLTLALGVTGCVRAPISKVPIAPTLGYGGVPTPRTFADPKLKALMATPPCTPVGGVQCTSNYDLWLPPHGYPNWDTQMNANFSIIDTAIAASGGGSVIPQANTFVGANWCIQTRAAAVYALAHSFSIIDASQYAASQTCSVDPLVNLGAAGSTTPLTILMPAAKISTSVPWLMNTTGVNLVGKGTASTILAYTGSSPVAAVLTVGGSDSGSYYVNNSYISGMSVVGGLANATDGILFQSAGAWTLDQVAVWGVTGCGIHTEGAVTWTMLSPHVWKDGAQRNGYYTGYSVPTSGICTDKTVGSATPSTDGTIISAIAQGVSGVGWDLRYGQQINFKGGTSEGNGSGLQVSTLGTAVSGNNTFDGIDVEANTANVNGADILDEGYGDKYINLVAGPSTTCTGGCVSSIYSNSSNPYEPNHFDGGTFTGGASAGPQGNHWIQTTQTASGYGFNGGQVYTEYDGTISAYPQYIYSPNLATGAQLGFYMGLDRYGATQNDDLLLRFANIGGAGSAANEALLGLVGSPALSVAGSGATGLPGSTSIAGNVDPIGQYAAQGIGAPAILSIVATGTGGTLNSSTQYCYRMTTLGSIFSSSETLPTGEGCVTTGGGANTYSIALTWAAQSFDVAGFNVYGRTTGTEQLITASPVAAGTYTYTDTGSASPSGALPTSDTTINGINVGPSYVSENFPDSFEVFSVSAPNLATNNLLQFCLGQDRYCSTNYNAAQFNYRYYGGSGSTSNALQMELTGGPSVFLYGTGLFQVPSLKDVGAASGSGYNCLQIDNGGNVANTGLPCAQPLTGTTGSIGGGALLVNTCATGTATVTDISSAMAISVTPVADPNASTTQDYDWYGYMSGTNTVTVKVCALVAGTPAATTYNVRAIQ
ncbi:MAG: hypothetical protein WB608_16250 [Terracidiphilus sp.]